MGKNELALRRTWAVALNGDVWEKPKVPLTLHQKHQKYRIAIFKAMSVLEQQGFRNLGFNLISGNIMLDVALKEVETANIVHITSYPGYRYEGTTVGYAADGGELKKVNARVTYLSSQLKSRYALQIGLVAVSSAIPVFVELPDDCEDPERFALKAIFATIADLATKIPSLEAAGRVAQEALGYEPSDIETPQWLLQE